MEDCSFSDQKCGGGLMSGGSKGGLGGGGGLAGWIRCSNHLRLDFRR